MDKIKKLLKSKKNIAIFASVSILTIGTGLYIIGSTDDQVEASLVADLASQKSSTEEQVDTKLGKAEGEEIEEKETEESEDLTNANEESKEEEIEEEEGAIDKKEEGEPTSQASTSSSKGESVKTTVNEDKSKKTSTSSQKKESKQVGTTAQAPVSKPAVASPAPSKPTAPASKPVASPPKPAEPVKKPEPKPDPAPSKPAELPYKASATEAERKAFENEIKQNAYDFADSDMVNVVNVNYPGSSGQKFNLTLQTGTGKMNSTHIDDIAFVRELLEDYLKKTGRKFETRNGLSAFWIAVF